VLPCPDRTGGCGARGLGLRGPTPSRRSAAELCGHFRGIPGSAAELARNTRGWLRPLMPCCRLARVQARLCTRPRIDRSVATTPEGSKGRTSYHGLVTRPKAAENLCPSCPLLSGAVYSARRPFSASLPGSDKAWRVPQADLGGLGLGQRVAGSPGRPKGLSGSPERGEQDRGSAAARSQRHDRKGSLLRTRPVSAPIRDLVVRAPGRDEEQERVSGRARSVTGASGHE
jgi:hypothetical protein